MPDCAIARTHELCERVTQRAGTPPRFRACSQNAHIPSLSFLSPSPSRRSPSRPPGGGGASATDRRSPTRRPVAIAPLQRPARSFQPRDPRRRPPRSGSPAEARAARANASEALRQPPRRRLDATLDSIASCESGGDPTAVSSDGSYRGKYQFDYGTWESVGGYGDPAAAPEAEQDYRAALLYAQSGSSPWPVCG